MQAVAWLVLLVVMLAAEAVTLGLTTIWFAAGALAAFLFALAGANLIIRGFGDSAVCHAAGCSEMAEQRPDTHQRGKPGWKDSGGDRAD